MNDLLFESKAMQDGFTQVQNCVIRSPRLTMQAKCLYTQLLAYAWSGSGYPGRERLAGENDVHPNTIDKHMKELKAIGLIEVKRRGLGLTNLYVIKNITSETYEKLAPYRFTPECESDSQYSVNQESRPSVTQKSQRNVKPKSHPSVKKEYEVKEYKDKEYEDEEQLTSLIKFMGENGFGMVSTHMIQELQYMQEETETALIKQAVIVSIENNVRKLSYIKKVLANWKAEGIQSLEQFEANEKAREVSRQEQGTQNAVRGTKTNRRDYFSELAASMEEEQSNEAHRDRPLN